MSTGSSPVYFHPPELGESRVGYDAVVAFGSNWADLGDGRDRAGRPAPSWATLHGASAHRVAESERFGYAGSVGGPVGNLTSPSFMQTSVRMSAAGVHSQATASGPFPARIGHASQVAARQLSCSSSEWNSSCSSQGGASANVSRPSFAEASALCFSNQAWDSLVTMPFVSGPRVHPLPLQVRSWEESEHTRIQLPSLINDASSLEPISPQNIDDDQDAYTFLCEWTDENGTCNMEILGDRVWMSHHLSKQHNVTGHERSQLACLWQGCADTMNKGSLARHIVSRHLRAGAMCGFCSKVYSRADVARRHTKKCKVANGALGQREQTK